MIYFVAAIAFFAMFVALPRFTLALILAGAGAFLGFWGGIILDLVGLGGEHHHNTPAIMGVCVIIGALAIPIAGLRTFR